MTGMSVYATSLMYYFESLTKPQGMLIQITLEYMSVCVCVYQDDSWKMGGKLFP